MVGRRVLISFLKRQLGQSWLICFCIFKANLRVKKAAIIIIRIIVIIISGGVFSMHTVSSKDQFISNTIVV